MKGTVPIRKRTDQVPAEGQVRNDMKSEVINE